MILYCNACEGRTGQKQTWRGNVNAFGYLWAVYICDVCRNYVYCKSSVTSRIVFERYPFAESHVSIDGVPNKILDDYKEAAKCHAAMAHKGCVAMCRRTLQNAAIDKGAEEKDRIIDQLKHLKDEQILLPELYSLATRIRLVGKKGAHPRKLLDKVEEKEAKEMLDFTAEVLNYLYTIKHRIKLHDKAQNIKKKGK